MLMPAGLSFLLIIPPFHLMLAEPSSISWLPCPLKLFELKGAEWILLYALGFMHTIYKCI